MAFDHLTTTARATLPANLAPLGPWALVTGASDGIGEATARAMAEKGFDVVLVARRKARLEAIAADLSQKHGARAQIIIADLSEEDGASSLLDELAAKGIARSDIGIAVLAAGYGKSGAIVDTHLSDERGMLRVNCEAVLQLSQTFAKSMVSRGHGQLVLFGSIVGFQGNAMSANYSATKAYVQALAEGLSVELRPQGVNVLSVAPGPIASGFAERAGQKMGKAGTPDEVARAIIRNLNSSGTIRPGLLSKLLGYSLAVTPRSLRIRIMSKIMKGMAEPSAVL